jgi:hypothetical protein
LAVSVQDLRRPVPDWERLRALFQDLEFTRLLATVEEAGGGIS